MGSHRLLLSSATLLTLLLFSEVVESTTFKIVNKCRRTIWPGILTGADRPLLTPTGFALKSGKSRTLRVPASWSGRVWARTHCSTDPSTGKFSCATADCASGKIECAGAGAIPPATLAEFTLNGDAGMDFYDVSLVDGYNLPMLVVPQGGTGANCTNTGCVVDLNGACPSELRVTSAGGERVACKSACEALREDQYCCSGAYGTPDACKPSQYSQVFKNACPHAYSYAYDDRTSTFTCAGANYAITFCPSPNTSQKSSSGGQIPNPNAGRGGSSNSAMDSSMVYEGALDASAAPSTCAHVLGVGIAGAAALWRLSGHHLF